MSYMVLIMYAINVFLNIGMAVYTKDKTYMIIALLWLIAGEIRTSRDGIRGK